MTELSEKSGKLLGLAILLAGMTGVSGCDSRADAPSREHRVVITNFAFEPETLTARAGDTVIWINRDIAPHTATSDDGTWDTGTLNKDESMTMVVEADMEASYFCRFHPNMKGSVAVANN